MRCSWWLDCGPSWPGLRRISTLLTNRFGGSADMAAKAGPRSGLPAKRTDKEHKRAQHRQQLGPLRNLLVQDKTRARYAEAFEEVCRYMRVPASAPVADWEAFDLTLGSYLESLWDEGKSRSQASYALASVQFFRPQAKSRIPYSWRLLKAWGGLDPPIRATPIPPEVALGLAGVLLQWKQARAAWLVLLGYSLFLRTGELISLRRSDVIPPSGLTAPVLFIPDSKAAQRSNRQADRLVVREKLAKRPSANCVTNYNPTRPCPS